MRAGILLEQPLAPVPGGTGRYSIELAASLARTAVPDDTLTAWTAWHRDLRRAVVAGVRGPQRLPSPRRPLIAAWERGLGPAPRKVDLVHAPTPLFPPRRRIPLIVTIHDVVPWTRPETLTPRGVDWHRAMAARAARVADAITVPTEAVAAQLREFLPQLRPEQLHVLGAGVSHAFRTPPSAALDADVTSRLQLPDRYVVSLATLEPRKGLDVLIAALAKLRGAAPSLLVVGQPGWGGVDLATAALTAGLSEDKVRLLGRLPDPELGVVLRRATLLAMPSRAEGFGLPVAEAMTVGTPVVCSADPALVEVAGDAAEIVPVGDASALAEAIDGLLQDDVRRHDLITRGLARAPQFDWDGVARRAWQLYRELAG